MRLELIPACNRQKPTKTLGENVNSPLQRGLGLGIKPDFLPLWYTVSPAVLLVTFDKLSEALAGAAIVKREARLALLLHAEAWRLHLWEGEAKVLVQVVQLVDEVAHISPQHLEKMEDDNILIVNKNCGLYIIN